MDEPQHSSSESAQQRKRMRRRRRSPSPQKASSSVRVPVTPPYNKGSELVAKGGDTKFQPKKSHSSPRAAPTKRRKEQSSKLLSDNFMIAITTTLSSRS